MNKIGYIILSFCCAVTLMLCWVVYISEKRITAIENYNYWSSPRNAFIRHTLSASFHFEPNEHEINRDNIRNSFWNDAYKKYISILSNEQIKNILTSKSGLELNIEDNRMECGSVAFTATHTMCHLRVSIWEVSKTNRKKILETAIGIGLSGNNDTWKISELDIVNPISAHRIKPKGYYLIETDN
jgi:hypothetical protein